MCPLEHLLDCHDLFNESWCSKKKGIDGVNDNGIAKFDNGLNDTHSTSYEDIFHRTSVGYYRSKTLDNDMYLKLKEEFSKFVTEDKLK